MESNTDDCIMFAYGSISGDLLPDTSASHLWYANAFSGTGGRKELARIK